MPPEARDVTPAKMRIDASLRWLRQRMGGGIRVWLSDRFLREDPTAATAFVPLCLISIALYTRSPFTNFISDTATRLCPM